MYDHLRKKEKKKRREELLLNGLDGEDVISEHTYELGSLFFLPSPSHSPSPSPYSRVLCLFRDILAICQVSSLISYTFHIQHIPHALKLL